MQKDDVVIVGGLGHVGLPLGIMLASKGKKVCLYDVNVDVSEQVQRGELPYVEYGAEGLLRNVIEQGTLTTSLDPSAISRASYVIIAVGTPVDKNLNPDVDYFLTIFRSLKCYLDPSQTIIVRSSVYPRTCARMFEELGGGAAWSFAYCPERIVQGFAVDELSKLPQIVAGFSDLAIENASALFELVSSKIIRTTMGEAELVKLFSNAWRYIQFGTANQFFMIANELGEDYQRIREVMIDGYERTNGIPGAGFAAGPCLLKDTMQLAAVSGGTFALGHAAMHINEGMPNHIVRELKKKVDIKGCRVGILGMAFKANIDDVRDSLSFKLAMVLRFEGAEVSCTDEYVNDDTFEQLDQVISNCEVLIVGAPHIQYHHLTIPVEKIVIDPWGII